LGQPRRVAGIISVDTLHDVESKIPPDQLDAVFKAMEADFKGANATLMSHYPMLEAPAQFNATLADILRQFR